jgi:PAS domain S-box-containing protein
MGQSEPPQESAIQPRQAGLFRRSAAWLFSQQHFHFKLLSGTAAGVSVIVLLASIFLYVTLRNHQQEVLRAHTIEVIRVSSLIENDIAALETGHRGLLLTGKADYVTAFNQRQEIIRKDIDRLTSLILNNPKQRKRVMKVQEVVQNWIDTVAASDMRVHEQAAADSAAQAKTVNLGNSLLDQARSILQSLQDEEQIGLNQRMLEQDWATQSSQMLDFLPKLERSVLEMQKEKRGYLLTSDQHFFESYQRALTDFYTYNGYLSILVANSPGQAELLAEIRANIERWIKTCAAPELDAKRDGKDASALGLNETGEKLMSDIRQSLGNLEQSELTRYETRTAIARRDRLVKTTVLGCLALLAVALLVVSNSYSFALVRRQLTKLEGVETRIRSIIENVLDGMMTLDEEGAICSLNPAAEKMFGYKEGEMVGYKYTKLIPKFYGNEPDAKPVPCAWEEMTKRTGSTTLALGRTRKLVSFPLEISLSQMQVDDKKLYVAMVRDVTERRRFEKEIAAEKESLAVTLRSIGDGVITTDVQGRIIILNNEAERLTGWTSQEAIGQPLKTVFNVAVDLAAQARVPRSAYRNELHSILSLPESATLTARDGTERILEQSASPIRDKQNEMAGVVLVFRDITQRQRDEAERRKAETLEQLGLLAGGIAHDFNNLLTAIIGNISLASLLLPPDAEMASRLVDAKNASLRARDLAQQLLTFARGGAPIKKTTSIGKLIQDTVSFSLRGSHSRSEFQFGADLWPAEIDPGQISQVIANLVVNADQAMPNGGTLRVSCDNFRYTATTTPDVPDLTPGDYIRIRVRDEGVGIPEQYLKRIFDPYFTTKPKGNGLGLATAYSIIKNHNGLVTVESEVHLGSTFTVYLPAALLEELPAEVPGVIVQPVTGTGRVLVVDDEEAIRTLVNFTLTRLGYEVMQAETALEGVNLYRLQLEKGERFDAVILDLTLPGGMGGKEALKKLIEIDPTVNAIVSSGYATDATMSRYQDFGFRGVIAKPYEAAELGKIVHEVISASHVNFGGHLDDGRLATRVA